MTETSSATYYNGGVDSLNNLNSINKMLTPVKWYPVWNPDQEVYFGTYDGAPYLNYQGYIADWTSGTSFDTDTLEAFDDNDSTATSRNVFYWTVDEVNIPLNESTNPWLDCDFGTWYNTSGIVPTCSVCEPSCLFGCDSAGACDANGYDQTYEDSHDNSSTCTTYVYGGKQSSGWSDDMEQNCRGCRGHAELVGFQTDNGFDYDGTATTREEGYCLCPEGFEGDAYGC